MGRNYKQKTKKKRDKVIWLHDLDIKVKDKDSKELPNKFIQFNENSELYKAQLKILATTYIKANAWERDYSTDYLELQNLGESFFSWPVLTTPPVQKTY